MTATAAVCVSGQRAVDRLLFLVVQAREMHLLVVDEKQFDVAESRARGFFGDVRRNLSRLQLMREFEQASHDARDVARRSFAHHGFSLHCCPRNVPIDGPGSTGMTWSYTAAMRTFRPEPAQRD